MNKLPWFVAPAVFLLFFGVYSFRLGIHPELMPDDYEYTYPSFSLAQRGNFGSPPVGSGRCLTMGVLGLWLWPGEGCHRPLVLFAMSLALTVGMLSHTSMAFFTLALALLCGVRVARHASWREATERASDDPIPGSALRARAALRPAAGALVYALTESGARAGERVFVPCPFGFHLRRTIDVVEHPASNYLQGRWSPAFRDGLRGIWGSETLARVNAQSLCYAMGLEFIRPTWIVSWDFDYSTMHPFYQFLRKYPDLPSMRLERASKVALPAPYGGTVRVNLLSLSEAISALDRTLHSTEAPCP